MIKYNYDQVLEIINKKGFILLSNNYKNCDSILTLMDKDGYYYTPSFTNLISGYNPSKFYKTNPYTIQNIKLWLSLNLSYLELLSKEYINSKHKLTLKDNEGYLYSLNLDSLINSNKCPSRFYKSNIYTIQNIELWCKLNNKPFKLINEEYRGSDSYLKWQCLKENCEEEFETNWESIYSGQLCSYCCVAPKKVGKSNCLATKRPDLASEWHPTKNGELTPYDVTPGSNKDVWWKCSVNPKHEWHIDVNHRTNNNNGCPYCSHTYPSEDYNLLIINPALASEWNVEKNNKNPEDYCPSAKEIVWWKCKECGNEWEKSIGARSTGQGCPECNKSKGEKRIKEILTEFKYIYESEYDKLKNLLGIGGNPLRFDFCVFEDSCNQNIKMLIEFDGKQHFEWIKGMMTKKEFEKLKHHDKLKNEYCKNNNLKLLRIKYDQFDKIEEILKRELITI